MKVLIYFNKQELKDSGGPNGYLYNLLKNYSGNEIELLDYSVANNGHLKKIYDKLPNFLKQIYRFIHNTRFFKTLKKGEHFNGLDFLKYDIVHFNECFSLYKERNFLKDFAGTIVLTNHTPSAPKVEAMNYFLTSFEKKFLKKKRSKFLDEIFNYSFNRADYICYPTLYSDESYYEEWPEYKRIIKNKKIIYLLTGITKKKINIDRIGFRKSHDISNNNFVISYVGRHNEVKGYDTVKKLFPIYSKNDHVTFLIGGKEYPLKGYKNEKNRVEVGWTNDAGSLINASDVFVLPNKETYFDIVLLEVLSLGIPIICSYTGGNKYFQGKSNGIFFYQSFEELIDKIDYLRSLGREKIKSLGLENKKLYEESFTNSVFLDNYINLMRSLLKHEN